MHRQHLKCFEARPRCLVVNENGVVTIEWQVTGEGAETRLHLKWTEKNGPPVMPPQRKGFGSRLIEKALAMELGGEVRVDYEVSGAICTIVAPLPENKEKVN